MYIILYFSSGSMILSDACEIGVWKRLIMSFVSPQVKLMIYHNDDNYKRENNTFHICAIYVKLISYT